MKTITGFDGKKCLQLTYRDLKQDAPDVFTYNGIVNKSHYSKSLSLEDFNVSSDIIDKHDSVYYVGLSVDDVCLGGRVLKGNLSDVMRTLQPTKQKTSEQL